MSEAVEVVSQTCTASVAECQSCEWRGNNRQHQPCVKCGGPVELRRCRRLPARGSTVCRWHGGEAPQVKRAGRRRLVAAEAARTLREVDVEPVGDPLLELGDVAAEARALQRHLGELAVDRQARCDPDAALWLEAYGVAMDRCARLLEACGRLGLEQRRVQVEEWQAAMAVEALELAIVDVGLATHTKAIKDAFATRVVEVEARRAD